MPSPRCHTIKTFQQAAKQPLHCIRHFELENTHRYNHVFWPQERSLKLREETDQILLQLGYRWTSPQVPSQDRVDVSHTYHSIQGQQPMVAVFSSICVAMNAECPEGSTEVAAERKLDNALIQLCIHSVPNAPVQLSCATSVAAAWHVVQTPHPLRHLSPPARSVSALIPRQV